MNEESSEKTSVREVAHSIIFVKQQSEKTKTQHSGILDGGWGSSEHLLQWDLNIVYNEFIQFKLPCIVLLNKAGFFKNK